jgi:hypothetical protein
MAHSYDLLVGDVNKKLPCITETILKVIQQVYAHFSQNPHQQRRLEALAAAWGADDLLQKITNLFLVLFVASEQQAVNNFASDLPAIIAALKDELDEVGISAEKKAKLNGWLSKMLQFKFAGFLFVIADVHTV